MTMSDEPLGAILAGGAASRLGGSKAGVELAGRPLIAYPLGALAAAGIETIVIAKPDTELPRLDVPVIREPAEPRHPLLGLVTALEEAGGRPIVTCPCDTPFVRAELLRGLAAAESTAAVHDGERLHPLLARYRADDLAALRDALVANRSATAALEALHPVLVTVDRATAFNVNTPGDLRVAEERIRDARTSGTPGGS